MSTILCARRNSADFFFLILPRSRDLFSSRFEREPNWIFLIKISSKFRSSKIVGIFYFQVEIDLNKEFVPYESTLSVHVIVMPIGRERLETELYIHSKTDTWDVYSTRDANDDIIARSDLVAIDRFLLRSRGYKGCDADGQSRLSLSSSTKSDPELETRFIVCDLTTRLLCVAVLFVDAKRPRLLTGDWHAIHLRLFSLVEIFEPHRAVEGLPKALVLIAWRYIDPIRSFGSRKIIPFRAVSISVPKQEFKFHISKDQYSACSLQILIVQINFRTLIINICQY